MSVCHLPHRPRLRFCSLAPWERWLFWARSSLRASMQPKPNVGLFSASPSISSVISQWWLPCSCHFSLNQNWDGLLNVEWMDEKVDGISIIHKTKVQKGSRGKSCKHWPAPWWQMISEALFIYWLFCRSVCKCLLLTCSCVNNKRGLSHCVDFSPGSRFFIVAVPLAVSAGIFLCPLYIQTQCPCLTEQLPKKPDLIGHRGAPMVSRTTFSPTTRGHTYRRHAGHRFVTTSPPLPLNQEEVIYTVQLHNFLTAVVSLELMCMCFVCVLVQTCFTDVHVYSLRWFATLYTCTSPHLPWPFTAGAGKYNDVIQQKHRVRSDGLWDGCTAQV